MNEAAPDQSETGDGAALLVNVYIPTLLESFYPCY